MHSVYIYTKAIMVFMEEILGSWADSQLVIKIHYQSNLLVTKS